MNGIKNKILALDSNVFIYHFEHNLKYAPYTTNIFNTLIDKSNQGISSVISIAESLSYPSPPLVVKKIEDKFKTLPNFTIYNVTQEIAIKAAQIRREFSFHLPDAIQLATAIHAKADLFITNDRRLKGFKGIKVILIDEFKS